MLMRKAIKEQFPKIGIYKAIIFLRLRKKAWQIVQDRELNLESLME